MSGFRLDPAKELVRDFRRLFERVGQLERQIARIKISIDPSAFRTINVTDARTGADATNKQILLSYTPYGSILVFKNGLALSHGPDYALDERILSFSVTPSVSDVLLVSYATVAA